MKRYLLFDSLVSWGVLVVFVLFALASQSSAPAQPGVRPDVGQTGQQAYELGQTLGPVILGLVVAAIVDAVIVRVRK